MSDRPMPVTILEWDNRETANRFSTSVVAAINEAHPGAIE